MQCDIKARDNLKIDKSKRKYYPRYSAALDPACPNILDSNRISLGMSE